ncbi:HNH endonuclease [Nocardia sp. BSTN01]|nr:HNH endonuclease [Nocardia sp. BSTN01]
MRCRPIPAGLFTRGDIHANVVVSETPNPVVGTPCWVWQGRRSSKGYGYIDRKGQGFRAHRVSYTVFRGQIPGGLVLDHLCRNTSCVKPEHLEAVTNRINLKRGVGLTAERVRARDSGRCINGHVLANVGLYRDGRYLKYAECNRSRSRERLSNPEVRAKKRERDRERYGAKKKAAQHAEGGGTG